MTKRRGIIIFIVVILLLIIGVFGYGAITKETERQRVLAAEQSQKEEAERFAREQAEAQRQREEALRQQLITGNYDSDLKIVFLTFDDGPNVNTNAVLDILKQNDVKATFFTNKRDEEYAEQYRRIVNEGHVLANHSASHNYSLYKNPQAFLQDVIDQENYLREVTGVEPVKLLRFPGGSNISNQATVDLIKQSGYNYVDWDASAGDGTSTPLPANQVFSKIVTEVNQQPVSVILTHAENPAKTTTLQALDSTIKELKAEGYTFMTIDPAYNLRQFLSPSV